MNGRASTILVAAIATMIAWLGATDRPGGWNDGSRFATVESLVDHSTWAIDNSIFCTAKPYGEGVAPRGTLDKLFIAGHYYSDKSPVPAVLMAGPYWVWRTLGGTSASEQPALVCFWLTFASAGLAYVIAVVSIDLLARQSLRGWTRITATASFALATIALPYSRSVNNHILLFGIVAVLLVGIDIIATQGWNWQLVSRVGFLSGLAYTIDLGAGPLIAAGTGLWVIFRCRSACALILFAVAALPWIALHHVINYSIGGTLGPANANPEYFNWPGCPFNVDNITGSWRHKSIVTFVLYAADLLVGKRGLLGHDLALYLSFPAAMLLFRQRHMRRLEVGLMVGWCVAIWLIYSATSNNYSGECCSVRWFVPLVAPGYYILIQFVRERPDAIRPFVALSSMCAMVTWQCWWRGPWSGRMPSGYWFIMVAAVIAWVRVARREVPPLPAASIQRDAA